MKTLIELYDDRPIENVLASEVFMPERTVFLCPSEVFQNKKAKNVIKEYLKSKGLQTEPVFLESSLYNGEKIAAQLRKILSEYEDCVVDITGGTDAALFACGRVCAETGLRAFTYSRKRNSFFSIYNAPFSEELPCKVEHKIEDCFRMAGGVMRMGRVDNKLLGKYENSFAAFFRIYLSHKTEWAKAVTYIQRVSQFSSLSVRGKYSVSGERGAKITVPEGILREAERIGYIKNLSVSKEAVSFSFADNTVRTWLRDVGSVLELFVYRECVASGLFGDVRTSAVVDWEGTGGRDDVTNEIDVMAMKGILPVFISCKTCAVTTEALNELAILRDRFGGKGAKAAIVTTQSCRTVTRNRASELQIDVIDLSDLKNGKLKDRLESLLEER